MSQIKRIYYAVRKIENFSVASIAYGDWARLVRSDGDVTELEQLPPNIKNPSLEASLIAVVGSGIANPTPGFDVFRYDPPDAPYIINMDHYKVIENLHVHPIYTDALKIAGLDDTPELRFELQNTVYVVKEPPNDYHWLEDFPQYLLHAKRKSE